ncbi:hypothetical protein M0811_04063 [Anaeramoeba ignava]|uniref:Biogenesis of lysosome-related organelles complex 1 subunit 1 n=1 Tax=Anaeramoeba ignava TaxID=1746090 RepID=A0A9Q0RH04_ANAIG|nr:hypothetical protein M0811_04063 [Anaeramoeba ignava]
MNVLLKDFRKNKKKLIEENENKWKEFEKRSQEVIETMYEGLNIQINEIFQNQKIIETENKKIQIQTINNEKLTNQWINLIKKLNSPLHDLSNSNDWAFNTEKNLKQLSQNLENLKNLNQKKK